MQITFQTYSLVISVTSLECVTHINLKEFSVAEIRVVVWLGLMKFNENDDVIESDEVMLNEFCTTNFMTNYIMRK